MKRKRIVLDVHEKLHADIKAAATSQDQTMKDFLLDMIMKQMVLYKQ